MAGRNTPKARRIQAFSEPVPPTLGVMSALGVSFDRLSAYQAEATSRYRRFSALHAPSPSLTPASHEMPDPGHPGERAR